MNTRNDILARIRRNAPTTTPLPELAHARTPYPDREVQFLTVLNFVGGQGQVVSSRDDLVATIRQLPCWPTARQIVCTVADLPVGNFQLDAVDDPHQLASVDVAILPGEFAVAENAAVWVTDRHVKHRAIYFATQHLVLVVPRDQICDHLHQAYERLKFEGVSYGLFISGPSKTADIEQSLVIGAHGPRSLTVLLVGP